MPPSDTPTTVTVSFGGHNTTIDYQPHAAMETLLAHARDAFGVSNQHLLGLFTADNRELQPYTNSIESFGIVPGEVLYLKPSTVRGGCRAC